MNVKKTLISVAAALLAPLLLSAQEPRTVEVSTSKITTLVFGSDLASVKLVDRNIRAEIPSKGSRKTLFLSAAAPFEGETTVTIIESDESVHMFMLRYNEDPANLLIYVNGASPAASVQSGSASPSQGGGGGSAGYDPRIAARQPKGEVGRDRLQAVFDASQRLFHLGDKEFHITVLCENIFVYDNVTYITISIENPTNIAYDVNDAAFALKTKSRGKRNVQADDVLYPRAKYGNLSVGPKGSSKAVYAFDKITLDYIHQVRVYIHERGGARDLEFDIDAKEFNEATTPGFFYEQEMEKRGVSTGAAKDKSNIAESYEAEKKEDRKTRKEETKEAAPAPEVQDFTDDHAREYASSSTIAAKEAEAAKAEAEKAKAEAEKAKAEAEAAKAEAERMRLEAEKAKAVAANTNTDNKETTKEISDKGKAAGPTSSAAEPSSGQAPSPASVKDNGGDSAKKKSPLDDNTKGTSRLGMRYDDPEEAELVRLWAEYERNR